MATIGQALTAPEAGWKRYDDTDVNITYVGSWLRTQNTIHYNGACQYSTKNGDAVKFNFIGTKLRIFSYASNVRTPSNNNKVIIDGVEVGSFSLKSESTIAQCLVFEKTGLENKEHYVEIVKLDSDAFYSDSYDIDSEGIFKPYQITVKNKILLLSNEKSYKLVASNKKNLIPQMTSNTSPSGIASASSFITGYEVPTLNFNINSR